MSSTPLHSPELEYLAVSQALAGKDPAALPLAVRADLLAEYSKEGLPLFRTRTAGLVRGEGWSLDFGILDEERLLTLTLGDLFRLPKKERERIAGYVLLPPVNARFLKMKLGAGACRDEGEIEAWDGRLGADAPV